MSKMKNLEGQRFGKLVGTSNYKKLNNGVLWKCKCDCGNEKWMRSGYLVNRAKNGKEVSCGCLKRIIDMKGERYGKLLVLDEHMRKGHSTYWMCECDCGNKKWISRSNIKRQTNCGCDFRKNMSEKMKGEYGLATKRKVYGDYKKSAKYRNYSFKLDIETFLDITQQNCYYCGVVPSNTEKSVCDNGDFTHNGIDRINNKKGYEIDNIFPCCWICNQMKSKFEKDVFLDQIVKISKNLNLS